MDEETRIRRAHTFDEIAELYDRGAGDIPSASSMTCLPKPAWIRSTRTCSRSVAARDKQHCRWLAVGAV